MASDEYARHKFCCFEEEDLDKDRKSRRRNNTGTWSSGVAGSVRTSVSRMNLDDDFRHESLHFDRYVNPKNQVCGGSGFSLIGEAGGAGSSVRSIVVGELHSSGSAVKEEIGAAKNEEEVAVPDVSSVVGVCESVVDEREDGATMFSDLAMLKIVPQKGVGTGEELIGAVTSFGSSTNMEKPGNKVQERRSYLYRGVSGGLSGKSSSPFHQTTTLLKASSLESIELSRWRAGQSSVHATCRAEEFGRLLKLFFESPARRCNNDRILEDLEKFLGGILFTSSNTNQNLEEERLVSEDTPEVCLGGDHDSDKKGEEAASAFTRSRFNAGQRQCATACMNLKKPEVRSHAQNLIDATQGNRVKALYEQTPHQMEQAKTESTSSRRYGSIADAKTSDSHLREEGLEVCKRLRHEDVQDPVLVLGADLMLCMLKLLDVRSLARASVLSKKWKAVVQNDTLWLPKCKMLWEDKIHIPRTAVQTGLLKAVAYRIAVKDAKRTTITKEDLCDHVWEFRFKTAAPQYWRNLDPSWRGDRAPMRRYFHANGTLTADANDPCWGGHEANYTVIDITGPGENFTKRFVRVNHWPMMQVHRKENWGWSLVSDFTVFDSLPDYEKGGTGPL
ncbi:unnamed protein product [Sphagnum jensenii]|uniref:F-box domain-containing protein n=1 Tax=Sphagnum jensenii TaxID=128206 RepID=A0ABP1AWE8_9BRYO